MKRLLSLALLSLTAISAQSHAAKIDMSLGEILGKSYFTDVYDRGGEAISFSDTDGQNDISEFVLDVKRANASNNFGLYLYDKSSESVWYDKFFTLFDAANSANDFTNIIFDFSSKTLTKQTGFIDGNHEVVLETTEYGSQGVKVEGASNFSDDGIGQFYEYISSLGMGQLEIGLFLDNGNEKLFSHSDLNAGGEDYLGIFDTGSALYFAWNDGTNGSNGDYRDMLIKGKDLAIVSEPETLVYFSLGLLGLGAVARRRKA